MSQTEYSENGAINVKVTKAPYVLNGNRAYSILFRLLNEKTQKQVVIFELATMINNRGYVFTVAGDTEEDARRQMESFLKTLKLPKDNGTQSSEKSTA